MHETGLFAPQAWETVCLIVGTTAGALIGLQFVVLTRITEAGMTRGYEQRDPLAHRSERVAMVRCAAR